MYPYDLNPRTLYSVVWSYKLIPQPCDVLFSVHVPTLFLLTRTIFSCPKVLVAQSCLTLWDPMDCSSPGSSVHGILQARILEWIAIPFFMGSSGPRDRTWVFCIAGRFYHLSHHGSPLMYKIPLNLSPGCTAAYFSRLGLGSSKQFSVTHPDYTLFLYSKQTAIAYCNRMSPQADELLMRAGCLFCSSLYP